MDSQPFQFSLRNLLAAVTVLCVLTALAISYPFVFVILVLLAALWLLNEVLRANP